MSKRDDLIEKYAADLRNKCGIEPDMDLLTRITVAAGPLIYQPDASMVSSSDPKEVATLRENFLKKKLGLPEGEALDKAIDDVFEIYGRSNRQKHRVVLHYLLATRLNKTAVFD